jgi:hypothetical protein
LTVDLVGEIAGRAEREHFGAFRSGTCLRSLFYGLLGPCLAFPGNLEKHFRFRILRKS